MRGGNKDIKIPLCPRSNGGGSRAAFFVAALKAAAAIA
jgi:hypothetical protein